MLAYVFSHPYLFLHDNISDSIHGSQNYNALSYDDRVLDGFYDLYGVSTDSSSGRMPSLIDLQETSSTESFQWEAILVNRAGDSNLLRLEEKAFRLRSGILDTKSGYLVRKLAVLVSDFMGGPVGNPENMVRAWQKFSCSLKETLGSKALPLGSLKIGLARHRALLFKVLVSAFSCLWDSFILFVFEYIDN